MSAAAKELPECDVVMKGGVTSGVIYPGAIAAIADRYRLKGLGGASAGAIGAAFAAAAEFGRAEGGFEDLKGVPQALKLGELFRGSWRTFGLLTIMKAVTVRPALLRLLLIPVTLLVVFPVTSVLGAALGVVTAWLGGQAGGHPVIVVGGVALAIVGWIVAIILRLLFALTVSVPTNLFGICTGHAARGKAQLTDWMSTQINALAHLPEGSPPLTFGQLWTGGLEGALVEEPADRVIDLRMVSTSLSQAMPVELPLMSGELYYDPVEWARLFPRDVMQALSDAPDRTREGHRLERYRERVAAAANHVPSLRRLPDPEFLPVIVATRMSLSFPLLISAVPLWAIEYKRGGEPPEFLKVWFTDGGLASNFPIHMFDRPLPTKPTFAINLGSFARADEKRPDREEFRYARNNSQLILSPYTRIKPWGFGAVSGFAAAALSTARNWRDNSHLSAPGYRDRIVQVMQTRSEGGLNLSMSSTTVTALSDRGRRAADALLDQFAHDNYLDAAGTKSVSGWENHVWVRYRALLAGMPRFVTGYRDGLAQEPPRRDTAAYGLDAAAELAEKLDTLMLAAADVLADVPDNVEAEPAPRTVIRRVPDV